MAVKKTAAEQPAETSVNAELAQSIATLPKVPGLE